MADVMLMRGVPEHIRSDNGAEMTAKVVRNSLTQVGAPITRLSASSQVGVISTGEPNQKVGTGFSKRLCSITMLERQSIQSEMIASAANRRDIREWPSSDQPMEFGTLRTDEIAADRRDA